MTAAYDVRVWMTAVCKGGQPTTDHIRRTLDGKQFKKVKQFNEAYGNNKARAASRRADPIPAACKGRAFSTAAGIPASPGTGIPVCPARAEGRMSRYECAYDVRIWKSS